MNAWQEILNKHIIIRGAFRNQVEHQQWRFFAKIDNGFQALTIFAKKLHRRSSSQFEIRLIDILINEIALLIKNLDENHVTNCFKNIDKSKSIAQMVFNWCLIVLTLPLPNKRPIREMTMQ